MTLAFVFPGQGSQSVGMLNALSAAHPAVGQTYDEASEVLGYDLWRVVSGDPDGRLNQTDVTQPALLAAGVAVWRVWLEQGGAPPQVMAGHSLGEYTALVCADALAFPEAVALVAERGRLMQEAVPEGAGAMAAVLGLSDEQVADVCRQAAQDGVVQPVNFNSPGQVAVAGERRAVERAMELAKAAGARRALVLPVSVPSHCALMEDAAAKLLQRLQGVAVQTPAIPVLHNFDVQAHGDADEIREVLAKQLYNPVRWVETIQAMAAQGVTKLVECGPGKVLVGLNKRIDKGMTAHAVFDPDSLQAALG